MADTTFIRATAGIVDANALIGCKVENPQGENLGKIESLMLDLRKSRIAYAVLSFGGFLGLGDKLFPVPMEAVRFNARDGRCVMDVDKETLQAAPGYDRDTLPDANDQAWRSRIFSHYGYTPYWEE